MVVPDISNRTDDMLALWPEPPPVAIFDTVSASLLMEDLMEAYVKVPSKGEIYLTSDLDPWSPSPRPTGKHSGYFDTLGLVTDATGSSSTFKSQDSSIHLVSYCSLYN